jgi:hypothetical protein
MSFSHFAKLFVTAAPHVPDATNHNANDKSFFMARVISPARARGKLKLCGAGSGLETACCSGDLWSPPAATDRHYKRQGYQRAAEALGSATFSKQRKTRPAGCPCACAPASL